MSTDRRFERDLPELLRDLYVGPAPEYRYDVLATTSRMRQRPAWTFPERWIPMSVITLARQSIRPLPWRTIGLLALLALLLAIAVATLVGGQHRLPPRFGPAANGLVAYANGSGDILAGDPEAGTSKPIVAGTDFDTDPRYSPDGTRLSFLRRLGTGEQYELWVADADGSNPKRITTDLVRTSDIVGWNPDGGSIIANSPLGNVVAYDVAKVGRPTTLIESAVVSTGAFRPPEGKEILFLRQTFDHIGLYVLAADGTTTRTIVELDKSKTWNGDELSGAQWSPDGSRIVFPMTLDGDSRQLRLRIANADGTNLHQLSMEPGVMYENNPIWSPDGTRIVFERWVNDDPNQPRIQALGVADVATGKTTDAGPELGAGGVLFGWSPDGTKLIAIAGEDGSPQTLIDPASGKFDDLTFVADPNSRPSWQRLAP